MIGYQDLLIGLGIAVFLFGAKRLPELAASLGKSMKEFKKATTQADTPDSAASRATTATAKICASCKTSLEADWSHCPRCGMPSTTTPRP